MCEITWTLLSKSNESNPKAGMPFHLWEPPDRRNSYVECIYDPLFPCFAFQPSCPGIVPSQGSDACVLCIQRTLSQGAFCRLRMNRWSFCAWSKCSIFTVDIFGYRHGINTFGRLIYRLAWESIVMNGSRFERFLVPAPKHGGFSLLASISATPS